MRSFLIVTFDGGGNVAPALGIGAELRRRGHTVRVLGHPAQRSSVERAGLRFEPFTHARPWSPNSTAGKAEWALKYVRMFTDRGYAADMAQALRREPVDAAVIDCFVFSALAEAQRAGLPHVSLVHTLNDAVLHMARSPIALTARLKGMAVRRLWDASNAVLVTTLRELDAVTPAANVRHVGPVWPLGGARPAAQEAGEARVLISLSSIYYVGQERVLQSIMDAVADLPAQFVLTTGDSVDPATLRAPRNVELHAFVPHTEIMPKVSLVLGHGGHSTAMLALAHELPLVVMPMSRLGDQPTVGHALQRAGAAMVVGRGGRPDLLRAAIVRMLGDGPHRAAATRLGERIRSVDGAVVAADEVEQLA